MPLSKARDKERKRLSRLETLISPPQESKPIQPDAKYIIAAAEYLDASTPWIDDIAEFVDDASENIDADGNEIPDYE